MTIELIWKQLDELFEKNEIDKVEPFLQKTLKDAETAEAYGIYISVANEMIGFYRSTSQFEKAFCSAQDVLLLMEELQLYGTEHFGTTLLNAATAYRAAGLNKEALEMYRHGAQIYENVLKPEDYRFAGLYNNMSLLYESMGENEQAAEMLNKALKIIEKIPEGKMERATTLTNLALIHLKMKKIPEGEKLLLEAIAIYRTVENGTDAHYSAALAGLGEVNFCLGKYKESLTFYEEALAEIKKHFGKNQSYELVSENCATVREKLERGL